MTVSFEKLRKNMKDAETYNRLSKYFRHLENNTLDEYYEEKEKKKK